MLMRGFWVFLTILLQEYGQALMTIKRSSWGETGSRSALPIWKGFMGAGLKKYGEHDFKIPLGIINVLIDPNKGVLADENTQETFMEAYVEGTEPGVQSMMSLSETKTQMVVIY